MDCADAGLPKEVSVVCAAVPFGSVADTADAPSAANASATVLAATRCAARFPKPAMLASSGPRSRRSYHHGDKRPSPVGGAGRPALFGSALVAVPDDPQALERERGVDSRDRLCVRRNQLRQAAGRDHLRLGAELAADARDDAVDLPGEAVDETRLERSRSRLADRGR